MKDKSGEKYWLSLRKSKDEDMKICKYELSSVKYHKNHVCFYFSSLLLL